MQSSRPKAIFLFVYKMFQIEVYFSLCGEGDKGRDLFIHHGCETEQSENHDRVLPGTQFYS